jgi:N-acetylglucosamine kinase-like BadF-type ATPase
MNTFLGVNGGGTSTELVLIDAGGRILARHREGSAYYLEIGLDALKEMLARGIQTVAGMASLSSAQITYAFVGLPAYGEDAKVIDRLDASPRPALADARYRCGNDMTSSWAGALACEDGINTFASTGSIAYGEFRGRRARAGGWGELFGDEASAYWITREALNVFSRMSDGRLPRGPLHILFKKHFGIINNLDICAAIYGQGPAVRSDIAKLAPLVAEAARKGDEAAKRIYAHGADELAAMVAAVAQWLEVPAGTALTVCYTGSMFKEADLLLEPFKQALARRAPAFRCAPPKLSAAVGAALYAAKLNGTPLNPQAVETIGGADIATWSD